MLYIINLLIELTASERIKWQRYSDDYFGVAIVNYEFLLSSEQYIRLSLKSLDSSSFSREVVATYMFSSNPSDTDDTAVKSSLRSLYELVSYPHLRNITAQLIRLK